MSRGAPACYTYPMTKYDVQITTPIYYPNGDPHIGHAFTTVVGDILKRCHELAGRTVFYSTGLDEHGQKMQDTIAKTNKTITQFLDEKAGVFKSLFEKLGIAYDTFIRTTEPRHVKFCQEILSRVYEKGLVEKSEYEGLYCVGCEQFKTQSDLDANGCCPDHKTKPVMQKEESYSFKMERFRPWLVKHIESHPEFIQPVEYRHAVLNMLAEPLPDLCISRPKSRVSHGIELPFDRDFVVYVWFDALLNYATVMGGELNPNCAHIMAKDIIKPHCIIWPIMLHSLGMTLPKHCYVHGYWTAADGSKMSKSLGNVVDPFQTIDLFGAETLRYFFARNMSRADSPISNDMVLAVHNGELANVIGNGFYRVIKFLDKQCAGHFPDVKQFRPADDAFLHETVNRIATFFAPTPKDPIIDFNFESVPAQTDLVAEIGRSINGFLDQNAPWKLAETDKPAFNSIMLTALEASRLMFELAYPIIPLASQSVFDALNTPFNPKHHTITARKIKAGPIGPYRVLFTRLDPKTEKKHG